jgi:hypothetical protein
MNIALQWIQKSKQSNKDFSKIQDSKAKAFIDLPSSETENWMKLTVLLLQNELQI